MRKKETYHILEDEKTTVLTKKQFDQELDKAREEGKEEQAELDRSIYGMSFEEFIKEYKPVEDLSLSPKEK